MAEPPKGYAPGGLLHGQRVTYSQQTKDLLNNMIQESHLTNLQRKELSKAIEDGKALPQPRNKPSNSKKSPPVKYTASGQKVLNPRNYSSGMRQRNQIEASGAYEREKYQPTPLTKFGGRYDKEKNRLVYIMAYGEEPTADSLTNGSRRRAKTPPPEPEEAKPLDRFTEIENEIIERRKFLEEMHALGCGSKYQNIVESEISRLVRELELIDKQENEELERRIRAQQQQQQQQQ